ncbi:hypothetical protein ACJX0J_012020, partial [Zea mays]
SESALRINFKLESLERTCPHIFSQEIHGRKFLQIIYIIQLYVSLDYKTLLEPKNNNASLQRMMKTELATDDLLMIQLEQLLLGLNCAQPIEHNNSHVAWLLFESFINTIHLPFIFKKVVHINYSLTLNTRWTNEILGMLPLAYGLAYISVLTMFFVRRLKFIILEKYHNKVQKNTKFFLSTYESLEENLQLSQLSQHIFLVFGHHLTSAQQIWSTTILLLKYTYLEIED